MTDTEILPEEIDDSRGNSDSLRAWRREKVWELKSCGLTTDEIVEALRPKEGIKISHGTVINDFKAKQEEIEKNFQSYVEKELLTQHHLILTGIERVLKEAWRMYARDENKAKEMLPIIITALKVKLDALGNPVVFEKAIKVVAEIKKALESQNQKKQEPQKPVEQEQPITKTPEPQAVEDDDPVIGIEIKEDPQEP